MANILPSSSSNAPTSSNQNGSINASFIHDFIQGTNVTLLALLQVKFQANGSSFQAGLPTIVAFILTIAIYFLACYAKKDGKFRSPETIEKYARLFGFLSNDLLLLMLVPVLGWIGLGIWACCFAAVTYWTCKNFIIQGFHNAKNRVLEKLKNLMGNGSESSTGSSEQTGSADGLDSMV